MRLWLFWLRWFSASADFNSGKFLTSRVEEIANLITNRSFDTQQLQVRAAGGANHNPIRYYMVKEPRIRIRGIACPISFWYISLLVVVDGIPIFHRRSGGICRHKP